MSDRGSGNDGYAIVLVIMIISILMVVGVLASNSSVTDLASVRNSVIYSQNLSAAESAAMDAIQKIENKTAVSEVTSGGANAPNWINTKTDTPAWGNLTCDLISQRGACEANALKYRFVGWSPAHGSSLSIHNEKKMYEGVVLGKHDSPNFGQVTVEIGYKKRF